MTVQGAKWTAGLHVLRDPLEARIGFGRERKRAPDQTMGRTSTRTATAPPRPLTGEIKEQSTTTTAMDLPAAREDKLDQILAAIATSREVLEQQIAGVSSSLSLLRDDHKKLADKVQHHEKEIAQIHPSVKQLTEQIQDLTARMRQVEGRAEDAEGRSRRNNLRVVGLPEGIEGRDPIQYAETWLKVIASENALTPHFSVERAHRIPGRRPPPGSAPRPMLIKLLHFRDRDIILRSCRASGPIKIENSSVMIFPDYTAAVQQQRATFLGVKRRLRELGYKYALLFPAKLRVQALGRTFFFEDPKETWDWLEKLDADPESVKSEGRRRGPRRTRLKREKKQTRKRAHNTPSPPLGQVLAAQQEALMTAAAFGANRDPPEEAENTSEDDVTSNSSSTSNISQIAGPEVTPQTADHLM